MKHLALLSAVSVVLVACFGDQTPTRPKGRPAADISDGAHGVNGVLGNSHFFFLPPLVPNPNATGEPNRFLAPTVEVCELAGSSCSNVVVARFTTTQGTGGETIHLVPGDGHYTVNWQTDLSQLNPLKNYRIRVLVGTAELGFADVDVGRNAGELRNVDRDEFIPLVNGRTLPIPFLIEVGAVCETGRFSCTTATVNQTGGIFFTTDRLAGVDICANCLPPGVDQVQLTIEQIPEDQFEPGSGPLPTDRQQFPFFFAFSTVPRVTFVHPVLVGVCQVTDPESRFFPRVDHGRLQLAHPNPAHPTTIEFLAPAPIPLFLACFREIDALPLQRGNLALQGLRNLFRLLAPRPLFASVTVGHGGIGGTTASFSPINAVVGDVDQQQPQINSDGSPLAIGGSSEEKLAQVVTAGRSGSLTAVRFPVACEASGTLIVEIQGVTEGGEPDGTVLAAQSFDGSSLPTPVTPEFRELAFRSPTSVSEGSQFAIVLRNPSTDPANSCAVLPGPEGDPYGGGHAFFDARPNEAGWLRLQPGDTGLPDDLPFQTVVP